MTIIKISEFRARCLEILDRVSNTGETFVITRRGKPLVRVLPAAPTQADSWVGSLRGSASAVDDLTAPAVDGEEWE